MIAAPTLHRGAAALRRVGEEDMAKKRPSRKPAGEPDRKPTPSELRWGRKTPTELRADAAKFRALAAKLEGYAASCEEHGIDSLRVDGFTQIEKAFDFGANYVKNVSSALDDNPAMFWNSPEA